MFGRKKDPPARKSGGGKALMAQMGLGGDMDDIYGDLENDEELEAELRALQGEIDSDSQIGGVRSRPAAGKGNAKTVHDLEKLIAQSIHAVGSDDEDMEVSDTEDPDLLAELEDLTLDDHSTSTSITKNVAPSRGQDNNLLSTLQDRLDNYRTATDGAKSAGDTSKTRRLERGVKTIEDLIKQTKAGKPISESDIPPLVVTAAPPSVTQNEFKKDEMSSGSALIIPTRQAPTLPPSVNSAHDAATVKSIQSVIKPENVVPQPAPRQPVSNPVPTVPRPAVNDTPFPHIPSVPSTDTSSTPLTSLNDEDMQKHAMLTARRDQYKAAALKMKRAGDEYKAKDYMRTAKEFDNVIQALLEGKPVDLTKMPPPMPTDRAPVQARVNTHQENISTINDTRQGTAANEEPLPDISAEDKKKLYKAPETANSVMDALQQRLAKYKESEAQAKQEENPSKSKRMGRIVKQYEDAIKSYKAGKPIDYEELPCPPGFPPIPTNSSGSGAPGGPSAGGSSAVVKGNAPSEVPTGVKQGQPTASAAGPAVAPRHTLQKQASMLHSRAEQQGAFLEQRQAQFKRAALQAKNSGDMELAKKYMRMAKGFDQMIEASKSGLPVDLSQVPAPPGDGDESNFEFVNQSDCTGDSGADSKDVYKRLQDELVTQIKMCETNREHFTKLGDVSSANKFQKMCEGTRKDLEALKNAFDHGDPVPRFHYESRQFSLLQCCTDLGDNDLEVVIVRGLNYNLPAGFAAADLHTYVKYEFPFPDTLQTGETSVIKASNFPEYNQSFKLEANRKSRAFLRLLKSSKCFKFDVYYRRGFLKGDKILGSVNIKLQPLEDKCVVHESYDSTSRVYCQRIMGQIPHGLPLMEGRKSVGGKLEIKIRVRDPYISKQVEEVKEKWLVIDQFIRKPQPQPQHPVEPSKVAKVTPRAGENLRPSPSSTSVSSSSSSSLMPVSMSVLMYEKQQLDQQIIKYQSKLKPSELDSLKQKGLHLQKQSDDVRTRLQKGGPPVIKGYVDGLKHLCQIYTEEAKTAASQKNQDKTQLMLTKRKFVEKEIESMQKRLAS